MPGNAPRSSAARCAWATRIRLGLRGGPAKGEAAAWSSVALKETGGPLGSISSWPTMMSSGNSSHRTISGRKGWGSAM